MLQKTTQISSRVLKVDVYYTHVK